MRRDVTAAGRLLASAAPAGSAGGDMLTVVIEGDGRAHDRAGRPTLDPTPDDPVGLRIARAWPDAPVAWLARPCQFTRRFDKTCRPEDWTVDRFSEPMLAALGAGVDELKRRSGATRVRLIGWSGGGVMAAALASRRDDVSGLVTFAAPLDVAAWTEAQGLSPLNLAADVAELGRTPLRVPQVHLFGERDGLVPLSVAAPAARKLAQDPAAVDIVTEGHRCCWDRRTADAAARLRDRRALGSRVDDSAVAPLHRSAEMTPRKSGVLCVCVSFVALAGAKLGSDSRCGCQRTP